MSTANLHLDTKIVESKDGTRIHAEACGDHNKPHVVFVHGIACTSAAFDPLFLIPELLEGLYLVRYDMRGHGRSGMPTTEDAYESIRYSDDFDAVCKTFNLHKPVYVGWSYAGSIASDICANLKPLPISGIVFLAAIPYVGDILPTITTPLLQSLLFPLATAETPAEALKARIDFCHAFVSEKTLPTVPQNDMAAWIGATVYLSPECAKYILMRKQDPSRLFEEAVNGLPLCTIHGSEDRYILGKAVVDQLKPRFKDFENHELDGVGHALTWEDPKAVADIILKFLARIKQSEV